MSSLYLTGDDKILVTQTPSWTHQSGIVRWNGNTKSFEIDCGTGSTPLTTATASITMHVEYVKVLDWAKQKMAEEAHIDELAELYPEIKQLKTRLDLALALVKDYE